MKTTLAAATAVELVKAGNATIAIDLDVEHQSLSLWAQDRAVQHPDREQISVQAAASADVALRIANAAIGAQVAIIDCPSRASEATIAIAAAADLVVMPIVPGRKDVLLTAVTLGTILNAGVKPERLALVLTRMLTEPEVRDHKEWLGSFVYRGDTLKLMVLDTPVLEKPVYRNAVSRGLAITEVAPVSLRKSARATIDELIGAAMASLDEQTEPTKEGVRV